MKSLFPFGALSCRAPEHRRLCVTSATENEFVLILLRLCMVYSLFHSTWNRYYHIKFIELDILSPL